MCDSGAFLHTYWLTSRQDHNKDDDKNIAEGQMAGVGSPVSSLVEYWYKK